MGIFIHQIINWDGDVANCIVRYGAKEFVCEVHDNTKKLGGCLNAVDSLLTEIVYDELVSIAAIHFYEDPDSLIDKFGDNYIIKGRVIQVIELESGGELIDIYIQCGADFISVMRERQHGNIGIDEGVQVIVNGLKFIPKLPS